MQVMLARVCSLRAIGRKLRRSASNISRELARGSGVVADALVVPGPGRPRTACSYRCATGEQRRQILELPPRGHKSRQARSAGTDRRGLMPGATSIEERPADINERLVPGRWKGDLTKCARNQSPIGTLVERKTLFTFLVALDNAAAEHTAQRFGFNRDCPLQRNWGEIPTPSPAEHTRGFHSNLHCPPTTCPTRSTNPSPSTTIAFIPKVMAPPRRRSLR